MVGIKGEEAGKTTLRKRGNDREEVRKKEKTTSIENYGIRRLEERTDGRVLKLGGAH